ncbi:MAG: putative bifunctional diguanylate cyclase/phosphodiesterase [Solirubrobacteraceae bacterium]
MIAAVCAALIGATILVRRTGRHERRRLEQATAQLAAIVEGSDDAILSKTLDGEITSWNEAAERIYGYSADEALGGHVSMLSAPGGESEFAEMLARLRAGERLVHVPTVRRRKDGSLIDVSLTVSPIRDSEGRITGASAIGRDITAERAAQTALADAEERFRRAFQQSPTGMALATIDGSIEQANEALAVLCGRPRSELVASRLRDLLHAADFELADEGIRALADEEIEQLAAELRMRSGTGPPAEVSLTATLLRYGGDRADKLLCQFQDITERKQFESRLQYVADHDPLTGLLNRRKFESELDRHVERIKRYGPAGALMLLDLDGFKQVNDTLGHNAGDQLIISVAGALQSRLRASDLLARIGGDEFAVLLFNGDREQATHVAQDLIEAIRSNIALRGGERRSVTASIGITLFESAGSSMTPESALGEADLAMYDAKAAGRDGHALYADIGNGARRGKARLTWVARIEHALQHNRFALAAQPILDLRSDAIHQHELLVRMIDDRGEWIAPADFLYIAERHGFISRLDEWVAGRAIELLEASPGLVLEVNISGRSLGDRRLLEALDERLRATSADPRNLIFEVTETAAVANITHAQAFAERLREHGCSFALDDFGAGFGSFYYLKHLPFDYVKIDGEFVQHALKVDQLVIEAVVGIARGLGKKTVAEFVTSAETQRMVAKLGVDYAQGYHIGKPIPVTQLTGSAVP